MWLWIASHLFQLGSSPFQKWNVFGRKTRCMVSALKTILQGKKNYLSYRYISTKPKENTTQHNLGSKYRYDTTVTTSTDHEQSLENLKQHFP
jgi:hypothetical protein